MSGELLKLHLADLDQNYHKILQRGQQNVKAPGTRYHMTMRQYGADPTTTVVMRVASG